MIIHIYLQIKEMTYNVSFQTLFTQSPLGHDPEEGSALGQIMSAKTCSTYFNTNLYAFFP